MPRRFSNDEEYNKELEKSILSYPSVAETLSEYEKYVAEHLDPISANLDSKRECYVPQEPFEGKSDELVCMPDIEMPEMDFSELRNDILKSVASDESSVNEIVDCISGNGQYSMKSISETIAKKSEELSKLKEIRSKFDEFRWNVFPYKYYLEQKKKKLKAPISTGADILFANFKVRLKLYSTSISVNYNTTKNVISKYEVAIEGYKDLKNYIRIGTNTANLKIFSENSIVNLIKPNKKTGDGLLYNKFYDKLSNPIENLFTLKERGMSKSNNKSGNLPVASYNSNGKANAYVSDLNRYKEFYEKLNSVIDYRIYETYDKICKDEIVTIKSAIDQLVFCEGHSNLTKKEIETLKYLNEFEDEYKKINERINALEYQTSEAGINSLISKNPCFKPQDSTPLDVKEDLTGSYMLTGGKYPNNPTFQQNCYWVKFCTIATMYGLLPYPEIGNTMRYWGIGMKVATPSGAFNVPMPTIWAPIMTLSTKLGIFVMLIGQIGIIPHPFILWINKNQVKRFVLTIKGPNLDSKPIGFDNDTSKFPEKNLYLRLPKLPDLNNVFNFGSILDVTKKEEEIDVDEDSEQLKKLKELVEKDPMNEILDGMNKVRNKMNEEKSALNINEELMQASRRLNDEIDKIKFPEKYNNFMNTVFETSDEYEKYLNDLLASIDLPSVRIPDDIKLDTALKFPGPDSKFHDMISILEKMNLPYVNIASMKDLKRYLISEITSVVNSGIIEDFVYNLPETLDLANEEDFNKVKEFISLSIDEIVANIPYQAFQCQEIFGKLISLGNEFSLSLGIDCGRTPIDFEYEITPMTQTMLNEIDTILSNPVNGLTYDMVKGFITSKIVKRSQILDLAKYIIEQSFPSMELPFDLEINPQKILGMILKVAMLLEDPKLELEHLFKKLIPEISQIGMKLNVFVSQIVSFIMKLINLGFLPMVPLTEEQLKMILHGIVNMAFNQKIPAFIQTYVMGIIGDVKSEFKDALDEVMSLILPEIQAIVILVDEIRNAFELINKAASIIKTIRTSKISFNGFDSVFSPKAVTDAVNSAIDCIVKNKGCSDSSYILDVVLCNHALLLLEKMKSMNFITVSAACWVNRDIAEMSIRSMHPISYADDLPPYERLTLNNPLFCLFLDDFCNEAKKYSFFGERYGI